MLVVRRDDEDVHTLNLPDDRPVTIRPNFDGSVGVTIGHDNDRQALLAHLCALMG